jgi:short-subunit dehydrogenase
MTDVANKVVLITGAGMGMGRLFAKRFANVSASLILVDVNDHALKNVSSELKTVNYTYVCDISDKEQVQELVKKVHKDAGDVDIVINNAGVLYGYPFSRCTEDIIEKTIRVNVIGTMLITRAFLPDLMSKKRGHIINMASASSLTGVPDLAVYASSKHAIEGFSESIRLEMKKYGFRDIYITLVYPHFVNTGMVTGVKSSVLLSPEDVVNTVVKAIQKNRLYVYIPWWLRFMRILFYVMPTSFSDWLLFKTGVNKAMDEWIGHEQRR